MSAFAILGGAQDSTNLREAQARLGGSGWCSPLAAAGCQVWVRGPHPPSIFRGAWGVEVLIGDVQARAEGVARETLLQSSSRLSRLEAARVLSRRVFGGYVAIWSPQEGRGLAGFRDPSGALDLLVWRWRDVTVMSSTLADTGLRKLTEGIGVNWSRIADFLMDPAEVAGAVALNGVDAVTPGELWEHPGVFAGPALRRSIWTPAGVARVGVTDRKTDASARGDGALEGLGRRLRRTVDHVLRRAGESGGRWLGELSGGLDSSIVAASWAQARDPHDVTWVNYHAREASSDERLYARAMAARLGVPVREIGKREGELDLARLAADARGARPPLNAMDPDYDEAVVAIAAELGCDRLLTGQGGDTVFWTRRTPLVASPGVEGGPMAPWDPRVRAVARWSRTTVWRVLHAARRPERELELARAGSAIGFAAPRLLADAVFSRRHDWLTDLEGVSPAKRLQIAELVACQNLFGEALRTRLLKVVHPLLAQPVVEISLATAAWDLVEGGRDRALARRAFGSRLPSPIAARRGKGDLTAYYGQRLARSCAAVRDHLLGGELASRGLLDRDRLDAMLDPDVLVWRGDYADLMDALAIEAWVRAWR